MLGPGAGRAGRDDLVDPLVVVEPHHGRPVRAGRTRYAIGQGVQRPGGCSDHTAGQLELAVTGRGRRLVPYADDVDPGQDGQLVLDPGQVVGVPHLHMDVVERPA